MQDLLLIFFFYRLFSFFKSAVCIDRENTVCNPFPGGGTGSGEHPKGVEICLERHISLTAVGFYRVQI